MNSEERFKASTDQILTYYGSQYRQWRVVVVKSIRKILLDLDGFYENIIEGIQTDETWISSIPYMYIQYLCLHPHHNQLCNSRIPYLLIVI